MVEVPMTKERWVEWLNDPVTQEFRNYLNGLADEGLEAMERGEFIRTNSLELTGVESVVAVAKIKQLRELAKAEFEDYAAFTEEKRNARQ